MGRRLLLTTVVVLMCAGCTSDQSDPEDAFTSEDREAWFDEHGSWFLGINPYLELGELKVDPSGLFHGGARMHFGWTAQEAIGSCLAADDDVNDFMTVAAPIPHVDFARRFEGVQGRGAILAKQCLSLSTDTSTSNVSAIASEAKALYDELETLADTIESDWRDGYLVDT